MNHNRSCKTIWTTCILIQRLILPLTYQENKHVHFSIQTDEEFAAEFMRVRVNVNLNKHPIPNVEYFVDMHVKIIYVF